MSMKRLLVEGVGLKVHTHSHTHNRWQCWRLTGSCWCLPPTVVSAALSHLNVFMATSCCGLVFKSTWQHTAFHHDDYPLKIHVHGSVHNINDNLSERTPLLRTICEFHNFNKTHKITQTHTEKSFIFNMYT